MDIRGVSSLSAYRSPASGTADATALAGDGSTESTGETDGKGAGSGGYVSPLLRYDQGARVAVLYFRDFDTGETQDQIPSRRAVEEYRRAAGRVNQTDHAASDPDKADAGTAAQNGGARTGSAATGSAPASSTTASGPGFSSAFAAPATSGGPASATDSAGAGVSAAPVPAASGGGGGPGGLVSVTV